MRLSRIQGSNFRLFERFELAPQPGLNLILGANAAGKTSLLEAIYALGRGRGFRSQPADLLRTGSPDWLLHGRLLQPERPESSIGLAWSGEGLQIRMDQTDARLEDIARGFPVQALQPESHRLLEDGPAYRRRYLDWGVFHVEHQFFPAWRRYQRVLKQRNQALKSGLSRAAVEAWNPELVSTGLTVHACRQSNLDLLRGYLIAEIQRLLNEPDWAIELASGWPAQQSLAEALTGHYEQDRRQGKTTCGPHRAELRLKRAGHTAKKHISRGQQKLLVAALMLGQARLIAQHSACPPVLLVDDFPAELGASYQASLLAALTDYPGQIFLSAIESTTALKSVPEAAVFHVEHGSVTPAKRV